ncbi:MAG: dihydroorotate dehydrogenase [Coriobacteriia bacterium]|nr:dihydroorotate dehydrogenase [Coriobacteriia bacterium]
MVDTSVNLSGLKLDNPIIPASGTFGFGYEFAEHYDINILGSIAIKGTTKEARYGNELPRIAETPSGMLNSVGLQNPGVDEVIRTELPKLQEVFSKKVLANVSGFSKEEYVEVASKLDAHDSVGIIELNISCPNVHGGGAAFGTDAKLAAEITKAVKKVCKKPVYVKLTPNVTDIVEIATSVADAGADGLVLINTVLGARFDIKTGKPILDNITGGLSGPAVLPIALRCVYQVAKATKLPIIGCGGIQKAEDVIEMMSAGARAVEVGAANCADPLACKRIIEELPKLMERLNIDSLSGIVGRSL